MKTKQNMEIETTMENITEKYFSKYNNHGKKKEPIERESRLTKHSSIFPQIMLLSCTD